MRLDPPNALRAARPAALVLGLDSHGLAVARALSRADICTYAMERDLALPGAATRSVQRVFQSDAYDGPALVDSLLRVREQLAGHDRVALLCMNDRQVETIGRHLDALSGAYAVAWGDAAPAVLQLQRKSELEAVCAQQGLAYPRSALVDENGIGAAAAFRYPVIVKPVRPLSSFKTHLASSPEGLLTWARQHAHDGPLLAQEFVPGDDTAIYFGALLLDQGKVLHGMVGRKLASHPPARGQTLIAETADDPAVLAATVRFFEGFRLSGPVSLELKRAPDGGLWVIEPTVGRTDFWAGLCIAAGFNQPLMEFELACGLPVSAPEPLRPSAWFDTERAPLAYLRWLWRQRRLGLQTSSLSFPYAGHSDPAPVRRQFVRLLGRAGRTLSARSARIARRLLPRRG